MSEDEQDEAERERERLYAWRLGELLSAGYPVVFAEDIAGRNDVDLHVACELVEQGCPPTTAVNILL
jgi:hypothetical protein